MSNRKCACRVETKSREVDGKKTEWDEIVMCAYHNCIRHRDSEEVEKLLFEFIERLG
jgi:hypothetical protein